MRRRQFSKSMTVMVPDGFPAAVATAAQGECTTPSEFIRRAVLDKLRLAGVPFAPARSRADLERVA